MIYIFHGDNQNQSRTRFNQQVDSLPDKNILRLDVKEITLEKINLFLNSTSLFSESKILALSGLFSLAKPITDKIFPLLNQSKHTTIIWHDKKLTPAQLKSIPSAKVDESPLPKTIFTTLYAIKPKNTKHLIPQLRKTLSVEPFELFLYLLKAHLRKQLEAQSVLPQEKLKTAYLSLIELEFQSKTGQLSIPKEIALERVLIQLIN